MASVLYAKRGRHPIEARICDLASREPDFPVPRSFSVECRESRRGLTGTWVVSEVAEGLRLAEAPADEWPQAAARLARFHETAADRCWADTATGFFERTTLLSMAQKTMDATVRRCTEGIYSGGDTAFPDHVAMDLSREWPSMVCLLLRMPRTLVHGDFHSGNVFVSSSGIELIDWDSATVAPGLLDIVGLVDTAERMKETSCDTAAVRRAYLRELSQRTRDAYGRIRDAWLALATLRALLELGWFALSGEDYGGRAQRELTTVHVCCRSPRGASRGIDSWL
jgi:aminoglycoside phosphotransferase (APT) family kinase protein